MRAIVSIYSLPQEVGRVVRIKKMTGVINPDYSCGYIKARACGCATANTTEARGAQF